MLDDPNITRQCRRCGTANQISLEAGSFACHKCGAANEYDNHALKEAMAEIRRKVKREQFKNPKNN